jgi:aspartyl-tRNA(Asn)/glutamyl-tRNA(Gln) amidotransferase subunit A
MIEYKKAIEISHLIKSKELKVKEVVEYFLKKIKEKDDKIKAFITICEEEAIAQAEKVQEGIIKGEFSDSKIVGVPVAVKDNIVTQNIRTTCASRILENWVPPYDATVVKKLKSAGAIIIGKTNLDEFAMGSSTENSAFFPTRNPFDLERVPGGSSGGSASAVGSGQVLLALGSDTGGSIRQPASFCGVFGLCPTYGRVSRFGLVAFASSLDRIGPFSVFVDDCAALLYHIAGYDPLDSTCPPVPVPDYLQVINEMIGKKVKLKMGVPREFFDVDGLDQKVKSKVLYAIEKLSSEFGFEIVEISLPMVKYALPIYYIIAPAEASSNLARYDGVKYGTRVEGENIFDMYYKTRNAGFGDEVKRRIFIGTFVLSSGYYDAYYLKAQKAITVVIKEFQDAFSKVDVIVCPVSPEVPFKLGEKTDDPIKMYLSDIFTIPSSIAGLPAISCPVGFVWEDGKKLPVGLQVIGKPFDETTILFVARCLELLKLD